MFAIFKREVRSCFHGMIGYVLTAFLLVASAIYFVALNLGYGLPDFGYYTLYNTIFMLLFYFPVLTMRSLCGGTPHPHRPAPAHQSGAGDGHRAGQVLCPVRGVCAALRGGRSHDPDPVGTGSDRCQYAGQFCGAAVLLSAGLHRHCHRGVPVQPDRKTRSSRRWPERRRCCWPI